MAAGIELHRGREGALSSAKLFKNYPLPSDTVRFAALEDKRPPIL
jgi:hypothetical protein